MINGKFNFLSCHLLKEIYRGEGGGGQRGRGGKGEGGTGGRWTHGLFATFRKKFAKGLQRTETKICSAHFSTNNFAIVNMEQMNCKYATVKGTVRPD